MKNRPLLLFFISWIFIHANGQSCSNGGFLESNGTCNCPSYWLPGNCSIASCALGDLSYPNGPTGSFCKCPPGYQGVHCDAGEGVLGFIKDCFSRRIRNPTVDLRPTSSDVQPLRESIRNVELLHREHLSTIYELCRKRLRPHLHPIHVLFHQGH